MAEHSDWKLYDYFAIALSVILNAVLLMLLVRRTLKAICKKEICVEEE